MKHYGIVGPGSLGLLWAAKLSQMHDVSLWGRSGALALAYTLVRPEQAGLPVSLGGAPREAPDVVLLTTKSYDALPAIQRAIAQWRGSPKAVVLFQNGLGSQQEVAVALPDIPVFAATTTEGAYRRDSDTVIHAGSGLTRVGALTTSEQCPRTAPEWSRAIVDDFLDAGFRAVEEPDIQRALWDKLLINAGINAFTVLLNVPNGRLLGHPFFEEHIASLSSELSDVSRTQGYDISSTAIETRIRKVAKDTADNTSSMLQDAQAGRRTEIEHINGAIVSIAQDRQIAVPTNEMLWRSVGQSFPGSDTV